MRLIIIRGPAGSGKSTIAHLLSELRSAPVIHLDEELPSDTLIVDGAIPLEDFSRTLCRLLPGIRDKKEVVLDGCFYYQELFTLFNDIELHIFSLVASLPTCIARDAERSVPLGAIAVEEVWNLVSKVKVGTRINAERSPEEILEKIVEMIEK